MRPTTHLSAALGASHKPVYTHHTTASVDGLSLVRDSLLNSGLSEQSTSMILSWWRVSTKKQYISYLHRWITFCADGHLNFFLRKMYRTS